MPSKFNMPDPIFGTIDLDQEYITDAELVDRYTGNFLFGFGRNHYGQLGNGTSTTSAAIGATVPVQTGSYLK
jgi:hypothetical protein